jgi:hypothetical protein
MSAEQVAAVAADLEVSCDAAEATAAASLRRRQHTDALPTAPGGCARLSALSAMLLLLLLMPAGEGGCQGCKEG